MSIIRSRSYDCEGLAPELGDFRHQQTKCSAFEATTKLVTNHSASETTAAFDGTGTPKISIAAYDRAALVLFDGRNIGIFNRTSAMPRPSEM